MRLAGTGGDGSKFRAFYVQAQKTPQLVRAHQVALQSMCDARPGDEDAARFLPHMSLLYKALSEDERGRVRREFGPTARNIPDFECAEVALVMTYGVNHRCWYEVARFPLGAR